MKHGIFLIVMILILSGTAFAKSNLKYKIADGEIVCIGKLPDLTAGAGERVVSVDFDVPDKPLSHFTFDGDKLIKKAQPVIDREEAKKNFKVYNLMGDLAADLKPESLLKLAPYAYALQSFADWKNWDGLKAVMKALADAGIAAEDEVKVIKKCFKKQN